MHDFDKNNYSLPRDNLLKLIKSGEFRPHFQPIVSLEDGRVVGFEMLARGISADGAELYPDDFISAMEHYGLLNDLTAMLLEYGLTAAIAWPEDLYLSINVSPSQLKGKLLPEIIKNIAERFRFNLSRLKIEITETALIDDIDTARAEVESLSEMGCTIAMDDFGTGCSSLAWLIQLPASTIKIDVSFIRSMLDKKDSRKIISSVVSLGRSLDMSVIAEGVETNEQAEMLREMGCECAQGYLFGKPMPAEETYRFLTAAPVISSHRRIARLSLDQRAHQISSMYAAPGVCICFLSPELFIVDASDTFAQRIGLAPRELINRHIFEVIPTESERLVWLQGFREKGLPYPPYQVKLPGGFVDLVMLTRIEDEGKDLLGFCLFGVDIISWLKAEKEQ